MELQYFLLVPNRPHDVHKNCKKSVTTTHDIHKNGKKKCYHQEPSNYLLQGQQIWQAMFQNVVDFSQLFLEITFWKLHSKYGKATARDFSLFPLIFGLEERMNVICNKQILCR